MSDYTPTTEDIREWADIDNDEDSEAFDRWLAEVKAQAITEFFTDNGLSYRARTLKEKAWQEGHGVGIGDALFEPIDYTANPYRQGEEQ